MLTASLLGIRNLPESSVDEIVVVVLAEHVKDIDIRFIESEVKELIKIKCTVIPLKSETSSMVRTVSEALNILNDEMSIIVKDCDNQIDFDVLVLDQSANGLCFADLQKFTTVTAANKSFVKFGVENTLSSIIEKRINGPLINTGCVKFSSSSDFIAADLELMAVGEKYVSDVVRVLLEHGQKFIGIEVDNYKDWGTLDDWLSYKKNYKTLFIDIDGVIVQNTSPSHSVNNWKSFNPIRSNVESILSLSKSGTHEIIFTTSRGEIHRKFLEQNLKNLGFVHFKLLCGLQHSTRILINDFAKSNPYPSSIGINIPRDSEFLALYLN